MNRAKVMGPRSAISARIAFDQHGVLADGLGIRQRLAAVAGDGGPVAGSMAIHGARS